MKKKNRNDKPKCRNLKHPKNCTCEQQRNPCAKRSKCPQVCKNALSKLHLNNSNPKDSYPNCKPSCEEGKKKKKKFCKPFKPDQCSNNLISKINSQCGNGLKKEEKRKKRSCSCCKPQPQPVCSQPIAKNNTRSCNCLACKALFQKAKSKLRPKSNFPRNDNQNFNQGDNRNRCACGEAYGRGQARNYFGRRNFAEDVNDYRGQDRLRGRQDAEADGRRNGYYGGMGGDEYRRGQARCCPEGGRDRACSRRINDDYTEVYCRRGCILKIKSGEELEAACCPDEGGRGLIIRVVPKPQKERDRGDRGLSCGRGKEWDCGRGKEWEKEFTRGRRQTCFTCQCVQKMSRPTSCESISRKTNKRPNSVETPFRKMDSCYRKFKYK